MICHFPYLNLISEIQENHEEHQIVTKYFGQQLPAASLENIIVNIKEITIS